MPRTFESTAIVGFAILATVLASGMVFSIQRSDAKAREQVTTIRAEEEEITLLERLRRNAELIVSSGRGYLLASDPALLQEFHESIDLFHDTMADLRRGKLTPNGRALADDAERTAVDLIQIQQELMEARQRTGDPARIVRRFENELLPVSDALDTLLSHLVQDQEAALQTHYDEAARERSRLVVRLYVLVGVLLVLSVGIGAYFARRLGRSNLRQYEALETARKAVAARDELMSIVAHDLRSPLGAITSKAALIRMGPDSAQAREQAESIEKVAMRMESLIKTMLDVTTMEAGRFSVRPAPCRVDEFLREVREMFETLAASRHIQFELPVPAPDLTIRAEHERMLQVLSNLIGNALKFTPRGGRVSVWAERIGGLVRFGVRDTGPGIPREHIAHIFDRFWKQDSAATKGTGLGLFIAKTIVDAHGGRIWVESEKGRGSCFYVELPTSST